MKGHMIFIEGRNTPTKVHTTPEGAYREMYRLARINPGKEILLFQVVKRVRSENGEKALSLGSHLPPGAKGIVERTDLMRSRDLPKEKISKKEIIRRLHETYDLPIQK